MKVIRDIKDKLVLKILSSYKLNKLRTRWYQIVYPCKSSQTIFIFGCQRSGTTMLAKVLGLSSLVKVYGEGDLPYFYQKEHPKYLRLKPESILKSYVSREKSRFTLLKPLYESQNAKKLIKNRPGSKAIWIFRNYMGVVDSHIKFYQDHDGVDYVKDLLKFDVSSWKNEGLDKDIIEQLELYANNDFSSATGYALFWLVRNSLYFKVKDDSNVMIINYEAMVERPINELRKVFGFIGVPFKNNYAKIIHNKSVSRKVNLDIDKDVMNLCDAMYCQLENEVDL